MAGSWSKYTASQVFRQVHGPDLTGAEAETGRARHHHVRVVVPGPAVPGLPAPHPVPQGRALRPPLVRPQPAEVEHLGGPLGHRQQHVEGAQLEGPRTVMAQVVTHAQDALLAELDVGRDVQEAAGVLELHLARLPAHGQQVEVPGRDAPAVDRGAAAPALVQGGQQGQPQRFVQGARRHGGHRRVGQRGQVPVGRVAEVGSPVDDDSRPRAAGVQHEAGARGPQMDDHQVTP
jgi:hypothetical protein